MAEGVDRVPPSGGRARAVTLLVAGAFFMEMLDGTVIATALPDIARSFGVGAVALNIGMTAYLVALAVFVPVSGWIADRFGGRAVFGGAILLFTVASVLCGLSGGLWSFTAARFVQGIGGAAMVPVGRLIVLRMTDRRHLVAAIGTIVWPGLVAPVLGPPLGGIIVQHLSWPWIFFLNLPLGIVALAATMLLVPGGRPDGPRRPLDIVGFLSSGAALMLIVYGIDTLGNGAHGVAVSLGLTLAGLALGATAVRHLRRHPAPLLDLSALAVPTFAVVVWGGSLLRIAIGSLPFLLPLFFQIGFGLDPVASGTLLLFVFAGNLAMKLATTRILRRFGFRRVMIGNGLCAAVAIAACALLTPTTPRWLIAAVLFAGGVFRSMQFTSLSSIQFADIPKDRMTSANTLSAMLAQLMMGLGVVIGAALLNGSIWAHGRAGEPPTLADFRAVFLIVAGLAIVGLIDSFRLDRDAGRAISGQGG